MKIYITPNTDPHPNTCDKSVSAIPKKSSQLSIANSFIRITKHEKSLKSSLSARAVINIHRTSSIPKLIQDPNYIPSIVSSVLHLQHKSQEVINNKIYNFQGGGFKGSIKKSQRIKKKLPELFAKVENINKKHLKTNSHGEIIGLLKRNQRSVDKGVTFSSFKGKVLGRRFTALDGIYNSDDN